MASPFCFCYAGAMKILGIVNITNDSFSDGGKYLSAEAATAHARALAMNADILDLGAASSNPDAVAVAPDVEIARLAPVVAALKRDGASISIDSFAPEVQRWALAQGVDYLNDIQGFPVAALYPLLATWKLRSKGLGRVVPTMRSDGEFLDDHTIRKHLKAALERLKLPALTWYQSTRHTFASHWVLSGNSLEKLREVMGHSTVQVTERYTHLKPELFGAADRATLKVSLAPGGEVVGARGHAVDIDPGDADRASG